MSDNIKFKVMVVDDTETNIDILVETLSDKYKVMVAIDGESALQDIEQNSPDLVLLDIMMPGIDGYEVCRVLKKNPLTMNIPVIFITALSEKEDEAKGLALGAVDYITKPFNPELVKARVRNHLELKKYQDNLENLVKARTMELDLTQEVTIECMTTLTESRDPETGGHIKRTKQYIKILAQKLRYNPKFKDFLDDDTIELIYKSAPLHDIGKVGILDHILFKPAKLTDGEFETIQKHCKIGASAIYTAEKKLGKNSFLHYAGQIAGTHHEKWDGTGYPKGLKGEQIPIPGRMMAVADVYDALITKRVYKEAYSHNKAVKLIFDGRGTQFDPDVVDAFMETEDEFRKAALESVDSDEERKLPTENEG
jgi:putative two-component system response regulator